MAEVKVKITAQNQTQTGFQAVLADAQRTATQVRQTMAQATDPGIRQFPQRQMEAPKPFVIDIGDYGLEPLRKMQEEIRKVRESARQGLDTQPAEDFNNGIGGIVGRFALLIGAAATVGKVIGAAFDRLSEAVRNVTALQLQFNKALSDAGSATSLEGAVAQFRQLRDLAEQTQKSIQETTGRNFGEAFANALSGRPGQLLARGADALTGGAVVDGLNAQAEQQRRIARDRLLANLEIQNLEAEAIAKAGGDPQAIEQVQREQQRRRERDALRAATENQSPQFRAQATSALEERFRLEDESIAAKERFKAEQDITKEKERQAAAAEREAQQEAKRLASEQERVAKRRRDFDQQIALSEAKLRGDKGAEDDILQQQDMDRVLEAGGTFEQASSIARQNSLQRQIDAALAAENTKASGSFGASALQRIGFASNEFFDTRTKKDPAEATERATAVAREILNILKKGEPLVLPSSN
jgi:hypothetical protein